ncbi:VanZ family protein [Marinifilum caeruleilacunae]|uniref:VanZ family protein n=1 Tax=Marinifilum caeruleilacunae TaxID=2499076 RepID=A0ABX1WWR9_9BACT|nr:VanZ family protein [Marinifilum caeruleilacunae]NOU60338.1 VanZ family protein [Marinifilum caeruleilacunae]
MPLFKSSLEKRLWGYVLLVWLAILTSLIFGYPVLQKLGAENMEALIFILCMIIIGTTVILHAFRRAKDKNDTVTVLGILAVFMMLFMRLGLAERSHLIEYSVLTVFIHRAMLERYKGKYKVFQIAGLTLLLSFLIGVLDECVQVFIPRRVFDMADFFFNGIAAAMAVGASVLWQWIRKNPL